MENKRRSRVLLIIVIILLLLLALLIWRQCSGSTDTTPDEPAFTATTTEEPSPTGATTGEPVPIEHTPTLSISSETPSLVGRWEGTLENNDFVVLIEGMIPSQQHVENIFLVSGCITFSDASNYSPMSGTAVLKEGAAYDIRWWGTMFGSPLETLLGLSESGVPIMLSGSVDSSLQGAEAQGEWSLFEAIGDWEAAYRGKEDVGCPVVDLDGSGLWVDVDISGVRQTTDQNRGVEGEQTQIDVYTNIVASSVLVEMADGSEATLFPDTDIFSPTVDFVSEFRFLNQALDGLPAEGTNSFVLVNALGDPIEGTERIDRWSGCEGGAPLNVRTTVQSDGIMVSWDPASGIETGPGGDFYQIELVQISDEFLIYGASSIYQTSHLMPFNSFMPGSAGFPDGNDFGRGLGAFEDGSYYFEVMSFQVGNADAGEFGNECQIRTSDERIFLEKVEGTFTLDP